MVSEIQAMDWVSAALVNIVIVMIVRSLSDFDRRWIDVLNATSGARKAD